MPEIFHHFVPAHAAESLHSIDLDKLWAGGKRLILMDVDHTLVKWKAEEFAPEILDWVRRAHGLGFGLCIISNTRRVERLGRLVAALNAAVWLGRPTPEAAADEGFGAGRPSHIETVRGRFKPSRAMFRLALIKFKCKPEQAVMIGDQLMTDILGANRAGIDAIWVRKMEGKEFIGTRLVNRMMERLLRSAIYKGLVAPVDESAPAGPVAVADKPITHQIVKFLIVGGSSFVIDAGLTYLLMRVVRVDGVLLSERLGESLRSSMPGLFGFARDDSGAASPILGGAASLVAMFNSFVWNRAWTFEQKGKEHRLSQLRRFYAVSILGALLNAGIFSALYNAMTAEHKTLLAKAIAALIVAVWNFLGMRLYAFRARSH